MIALKRWYGSLTLSSPSPNFSRMGLWAWLLGLLALLILVVMVQGPKRALSQLLDVSGLMQLLSSGMARLRKASRIVAILLGATVIAWTSWQTPLHNRPERKDELGTLINPKTKNRTELAIEQGTLAALTPMRDVLGLGDTWILLLGTTALIFKFSADRWGRFDVSSSAFRGSATGWTTICWVGSGVYLMYRLAGMIYDADPLQPLGGCLFPEIGAVPSLMVLSDAVILAWLLVELRGAAPGEDGDGFDVAQAVNLVPAAILACLLGMPSRYLATGVGIAVFHHLPTNLAQSPWVKFFMKGWGLIELQAIALLFVGLTGAVAWTRGGWGESFRGYGRMLRADGGRLVAILALGGTVAGILSSAAYLSVLSLPSQPWVLSAADSYAHYATLPIGLVILASLVELASRCPSEAMLKERIALQEKGLVFLDPSR